MFVSYKERNEKMITAIVVFAYYLKMKSYFMCDDEINFLNIEWQQRNLIKETCR